MLNLLTYKLSAPSKLINLRNPDRSSSSNLLPMYSRDMLMCSFVLLLVSIFTSSALTERTESVSKDNAENDLSCEDTVDYGSGLLS